MADNNIIFIGMPAVGKSTVGVVIAKRLGYKFVDTDILIQESEGKLLKDIIADVGPDGFLKVEDRVNAQVKAERKLHIRQQWKGSCFWRMTDVFR